MDPSRLPRCRSRTPSPHTERMSQDRASPMPRACMPPNSHPAERFGAHGDDFGYLSDATDRARSKTRCDTGSFTMENHSVDGASTCSEMDLPVDPCTYLSASDRIVHDRMRRRLKFFFMNPWKKWKAKRKFPWKMIVQILKLILITVQLSLFGDWRSAHVNFMEKGTISFKHLYLKDWSAAYETIPYPPASGPYAIYTIPDFYALVDFAQERYNKTEEIAIGTYHFSKNNDSKQALRLCNTHYRVGRLFAYNETYFYDRTKVETCTDLKPVKKKNETVFDSKAYLESQNRTIHFDTVIRIELKMELKTVHLKGLSPDNLPDCYQFDIKIILDNSKHNGQLLIDLIAEDIPLDCHGHILFDSDEMLVSIVETLFDSVVICLCVLSCLLTCRSLVRGQKLRKLASNFFKKHLNKELEFYDKMEFLDFWYILIIITDILTITGSVLKIEINHKLLHRYDTCAVALGTSGLFVWFGLLRYLSFFEKYNILIITMKKSLPNVMRFLLCAGLLYLGFLFCGWLVLGPYHLKFRGLATASECLFSLINGDDMFTTFSVISDKNNYVWWYSRIYLYLFISLFIYVVLSVFISVIMDSYETIKYYYKHGFPKSDLIEFMEQCKEDHNSPLYMSDEEYSSTSCWTRAKIYFSNRRLRSSTNIAHHAEVESDDERTPLIN